MSLSVHFLLLGCFAGKEMKSSVIKLNRKGREKALFGGPGSFPHGPFFLDLHRGIAVFPLTLGRH